MLLQCSTLILSTLIEEYKKRFNTLDQEIHAFIKQSEHWRTHFQFLEKDIKLKEHLEVFHKNLIKSKDLKFERDRVASSEGRAYRWSIVKRNFYDL